MVPTTCKPGEIVSGSIVITTVIITEFYVLLLYKLFKECWNVKIESLKGKYFSVSDLFIDRTDSGEMSVLPPIPKGPFSHTEPNQRVVVSIKVAKSCQTLEHETQLITPN